MYYKLITFDITNTLIKLSASPGVRYAKIAKIYGVQAESERLNASFRAQWRTLNATYPNFGFGSGLDCKQWWGNIVEQTFQSSGYDLNDEKLKAISNHLYEIYGTKSCWDVRQGAIHTLQSLKNAGLCIGVISNFDDRLHKILDETDLKWHFDFVLVSYECGFHKPQREIFDAALETSKCSPREAVHVGDDLQLDYWAAKNAGWDAILLSSDINHDRQGLNVIHDIGDTLTIVKKRPTTS